jgi:hypothetical protein
MGSEMARKPAVWFPFCLRYVGKQLRGFSSNFELEAKKKTPMQYY